MPKLTIFPLGNADCCLIDLANKKKVLFDYAATREADATDDLRADLPTRLREDLDAADRKDYDVVAISHLDKDHYQGASEFFWLDHAKKYQSDDRVKIKTLWVPSAVITEEGVDDDEGRVIQAEARYRFKKGVGIRVFSRPERLKDWLEKNGIKPEDRKGLITDAGQLAPEFSKLTDEAEFFVHSPFAKRQDEKTIEDRNSDALILHITFFCQGVETKFFLSADAPHDVLTDIVNITEAKKNGNRLCWDVLKLPHHCSYRSLGPDKGKDKTEPVEVVKSLYETHALKKAVIIATCEPIPEKGTAEDKDDNPPHRQAANYYRGLENQDQEVQFVVTMEHPKRTKPEELVIEIDAFKATVRKRAIAAAAAVVSQRAPRAG